MPVKQKRHFAHLKQKWSARHHKLQETLWTKHGESLQRLVDSTRQLAVGSFGSLLLLTAPNPPLLSVPQPILVQEALAKEFDKETFLMTDLGDILPSEMRELTTEEEQRVINIMSRNFQVKLAAELEGKRLNRSYGFIGAEQHLARYPGDTMYSHFETSGEARIYWSSGMAPGLGAWGYFAPSQSQMTQQDVLQEKYYIAVQTFLSKDFNNRFAEYRDFYKYRKMLVVNPDNGNGIVAVIGDAGPATWTGKHLGGSPEVMKHLERVDGKRKGAVLFFFIDDPNDIVPLGPIAVQ